MTERVKGFTVTLSKDIREDDFEYILNAVKMIRGVAHVEPTLAAPQDHAIRVRFKMELQQRLDQLMNEF